MMKYLWLICLTLYCTLANASSCPDTTAYDKARAIIKDLGRIETPNGIQESYTLEINGIQQALNVRGKDKNNPILLFVHGGPASPIMPGMWQFQRPLEDYFTVVNWDQRGAGKTYLLNDLDALQANMTIADYVADTVAITQHIIQRYGKQKVILLGHSWGTIVGMKAALQQPELFYAYVGVGQVINTRENERLSVEYAVAQAKQHNNTQAMAELAELGPYPGDKPLTRERIIAARKWPQHYGGLTAYRTESTYFYRAAMLSPEYNADEVCAINKGSLFSLQLLLDEFLAVDYSKVQQFPLPVVMLMGRHDYTTPSGPIANWLNQVKAPFKAGIWFELSAHMLPWEEPGRFAVELVNVVRPLAQ
jgi:pimeloyl-ACP methyl ester carboxylesterase